MNLIRIFPFLILFSLAFCKKSDQYGALSTHDFMPPLIVRTALADSLPPQAIKKLQLENIQGIKVKYATGRYVCYFDYDADRSSLLDTIARLPFSKFTPLADTTCRRIPIESIELMRAMVSPEERETGNSFWHADIDEFEVYECIKAPFRHTLLIGKKTTRVIHRIEFRG